MQRFHSHGFWCLALIAALALLHYAATATAQDAIHPAKKPNESFEADIVVYGGTSSGVIAAVQAKKMGKSVILVGPDKHLGGLTSGGLGFTDTGNKAVIGGLSRDFYHRIWQKYQEPATWRWQKQSEYGNKGQGTQAIDGENRTMWIFEPHVAERVFEDYIKEFRIPVYRDEWLDRSAGVKKDGTRIVSISTLSGKTFVGKMFIDATYEGDLLAAADVDYHVGREANSVYGEKWNGVQTGVLHHRHHFGVLKTKISPYLIPGDPTSGVLPRVSDSPPGEYGSGDQRIQAYCYRYCATDHPENRLPFPQPDGYDPKQYELLLRIYEAGWRETFGKFDPIPNRKTDTNNHGPFSTDNIGMSYDYPEATYERRREILDEHRKYEQGWLYFVANDSRVPRDVQAAMRKWGLAKDEFTDNGNWPHQIYVREARRMVGKFVMTENELTKRTPTPEPVGMGSYSIDSHNVQRYITPEGYVQNEGDIGVPISPYTIAYGSLVPKKSQCENLMASVCVSSSHIAFGSIRMEPVFMTLGQSAATGAVLALDGELAVQDVPYSQLRDQLLRDGQVLKYASANTSQSGGTLESGFEPSKSRRSAGKIPAPMYADLAYGNHERHVLDFWQAVDTDGPAPVFVWIHGGGFRAGNKSSIPADLLNGCLKEGISVASIHYRLSSHAPYPAQMLDSARAIQFIRSKAKDWSIDPKRIAAGGGSAGSGISQWLAFHDEMAQPDSDDPVARQSTRLVCAIPINMQSTYDPREIKELIPGDAYKHPAFIPLFDLPADWNLDTAKIDAKLDRLIRDASPINHLTKDDVPIYLIHYERSNKPGNIHHSNFGKHLKLAMDKLNIECVRHMDADFESMSEAYADMVRFLQKHFE